MQVARAPYDRAAGGPTLTGGVTGNGGFGRLAFEAMPTFPTFWRAGFVAGLEAGIESWRDGDAAGGGFTYAGVIGVRVPGLRATIGIGDELGAARWMDDSHVAFGGFALANVSIDLFGIRAGIDARIAHQFVAGAPDFTRTQLGISVGYTWPAKHGL